MAATDYLRALDAGDASRTALAEDAHRYENRRLNGGSAAEIREQMSEMDVEVVGARMWAEGDQAIAIYELAWGETGHSWAASRVQGAGKTIEEIETVCVSDLRCGAPAPS